MVFAACLWVSILLPPWDGLNNYPNKLQCFVVLDGHVASKPSRNDNDIGRSVVADRTTSAYFRRSSSSNGSSHLRSHVSFGRSNRDRDWEKDIYDSRDKEKSILGDHRRRECYETLEQIFPSRFEKDMRRSQSMITGKREERQAAPEMGRVSSPGLSTAIQSLPIGTSAVIGGDRWTSALAEVPVLVGSNGTAGSIQQTIPPTSASLATSMMTGLNMAETLVQAPSRAHTISPQLSAGTQRLEELALKQSRVLIPMTPSMPKPLVLNPSEKPKPKIGQQQQHQTSSSHLANHSPRSGPVKSDVSRTSSVGKLHVLKLARGKNGVSPTAKDTLSPTSGSSRVASSPVAVAPSVVGSAPLRGPSNNPSIASAERKSAPNVRQRGSNSESNEQVDLNSEYSEQVDQLGQEFYSKASQTLILSISHPPAPLLVAAIAPSDYCLPLPSPSLPPHCSDDPPLPIPPSSTLFPTHLCYPAAPTPTPTIPNLSLPQGHHNDKSQQINSCNILHITSGDAI
ncbi:hypothetical protein LOK49_LG12G00211 [Camellia lanceoleosa]|uniref:Uncharacterized protein n=1 Tax=Camellia lanceoleosa TaxID=1840588 RepID=A0ACC0FRM1_9ERIC|nr:hypothetical protein LOK49_LG12G00211 [Camellia lanceoleosa]